MGSSLIALYPIEAGTSFNNSVAEEHSIPTRYMILYKSHYTWEKPKYGISMI